MGQTIPLSRGHRDQFLTWLGGEVGKGVPVTVRFLGSRKKAETEAKKLRSYGYRTTVKRDYARHGNRGGVS